MQHLVGGSVQVSGPGEINQMLPVPPPHPANEFAGMTPDHAAARNQWFRDVAVLAFPTPAGATTLIDEVNIKILKDVQPYSIRRTQQRFVMPQAAYSEPPVDKILDVTKVVDLTSQLKPDGRIQWKVPPGNWTVMRFVARSTGQTTRPAPRTGHGFENDKFDGATYRRHWDQYQKKLLEKVVAKGGPLQQGRGLTTIHLDSWEMSSQNWTPKFRETFRKSCGYDPQPFYPAWMGLVVGSREKTERFLWDMRRTAQELVIAEHAEVIKQIARDKGLLYSNEPYDMNPAGNLDLGSVSDIPMCEFWIDSHDTQYSCIEAAAIAHTMGRPVVKAEAFTGTAPFDHNPATMKNQTDWALAIGINGFVFHTFQHQPLGDDAKPGMTFGPYGIHWNRNQTFWEMLPGYHQYLTRCSHLLRQGVAVSDILYLTPEGAPHIFEAPADALEGAANMRDKKGYSFDAVSPRILNMRAKVEDGRIVFPEGSQYRVLVLPDVPTMTPETLTKIGELVRAGATVIGNPPVKSPSLENFPACDAKVASLAQTMWPGTTAPAAATRIDCGKGAIHWGGDLDPKTDIYPDYSATAAVLAGLGLPEDYTSPSGKLRFIHRRTKEREIYFVSNRSGENLTTEGVFRVEGLPPELWDPVTGKTRALQSYQNTDGVTRVPLTFEPYQSYFIFFDHRNKDNGLPQSPSDNFSALSEVTALGGAWEVAFDPARGGPTKVTFDALIDWTRRPEPGIRYYSGTATYQKTFDVPEAALKNDAFLDLGTVHSLCRVRLNGRDLGTVWTAPWRVEVSSALKASGNRLEIEVANNWANRLIGDQRPADAKARTLSWPSGLLGGAKQRTGRHTYVWKKHYKASSPLMPSGLIGPVSIRSTGAKSAHPSP
jgi:hypothetical protein